MMSAALRSPLERRHRGRLGLIAIIAALLLAAIIIALIRMPFAETLSGSDNRLSATGAQAITLYNVRAAPVMRYEGAIGAGLKLSVSTARFDPATRQKLTELGVQLPNVRGAQLEWQAAPDPNGRITVQIGNQRQAPDAGLLLQPGDGGAELDVRAVQTNLTARIEIASQTPAGSTGPQLKFGDAAFGGPALATMPIQVEIPPGESMKLVFDNGDALARSSFGMDETALALGRAEAGPVSGGPQLASVSTGLCAARAGMPLLTNAYPSPDECRLAGDRLVATGIAVTPGTVALALKGSGFVLKNGQVRQPRLGPALIAHPLIAGLIVVLACAIGWPLWRLWKGTGR